MLKAVNFDMDGVIFDSEPEYLNFILDYVHTKNPAVTLEELYPTVGASREDTWNCVAQVMRTGQTWQEISDEYHAFINVYDHMDYRRIFRPEVPGILARLQDMGLELALASSTRMSIIERVLNENGIRDYFKTIVSGTQFKRSKPDPEIYHYTAAQLGLPEADCLAVEDSALGITAASRAGMKIAALIDNRFCFDQSLADYRMEKLTEIPGIAAEFMKIIQP